MLDILGRPFTACDRVTRRTVLSVGSLGLAGCTLPDLLRSRARAAEVGVPRKDTAVIMIFLRGGPSHLDMYDLKPEAPAEFRGDFRPIDTNVPGIQISEHLPHEARVMDKMAVVRSTTHTNAGHGMGAQWMMTGRVPTIEINDNIFPSAGSIVAKMRGSNAAALPAYVSVPNEVDFGKAAYLGAAYNPFNPGNDPNNDHFQVRNLKLPGRVPLARLQKRRALLQDLDTLRRDVDTQGMATGLDSFYREAMEMVTSRAAQEAFDINQEDLKLRDFYGRNTWGQCCLLARRLVEAGVTYVAVNMGGWDTHADNFNVLRTRLLPNYDQAVAALVEDLYQRGLNDRVLVMTMGEFGRTPRINPGAGRDHWPGAMSVVLAGGGLKMGQMIGTTDPRAEYPATRPCTPGDILSTMYRVLGIDYNHVFYDAARRPMPILSEGRPIEELCG